MFTRIYKIKCFYTLSVGGEALLANKNKLRRRGNTQLNK
jgi:hypothetical protein